MSKVLLKEQRIHATGFSMKQTQVGSTNEQKLHWVLKKEEQTGSKAMCVMPKMLLTGALLSHTSYNIYFQLAEEKKSELYFKTTDQKADISFPQHTKDFACI